MLKLQSFEQIVTDANPWCGEQIKWSFVYKESASQIIIIITSLYYIEISIFFSSALINMIVFSAFYYEYHATNNWRSLLGCMHASNTTYQSITKLSYSRRSKLNVISQ